MSEEHDKNNKPLSMRMFGWLFADAQWGFVGLFSLLLVGAIIIQAPWKVMVLWGMVLSFAIVLSRAQRNWMWFFLTVISISLIAWMALPYREDGKWEQYMFNEELSLLESQRLTGRSPNAADIYNEIFESCDDEVFDEIFEFRDSKDLTLFNAWSAEEYPLLAEWMADNVETIEGFVGAADISYCDFGIPSTPLKMNRQFWRNGLAKRWAQVLVRCANYDIGSGRSEEAIRKLSAVLKMSEHHYQQANLLDMPSALWLELTALDAINNFIIQHDARAVQLERIEKQLEESVRDWESEWQMIFAERKLFIKNTAGMCYEVNDTGEVRLNRNVFKTMNRQLSTRIPLNRFLGRLGRLGVVVQWFIIPARPEVVSEMIDRDFGKYAETIASGDDIAKSAEEMFISFEKMRTGKLVLLRLNCAALVDLAARRNVSYYYPLYNQYLRSVSAKRACRLIIALKRYYNDEGHWPESLDEIRNSVPDEIFIDTVNGGEFVYRCVGDDFVLYSKGGNCIDDGGLNVARQGRDDLRIWPVRKDYDSLWMLEPKSLPVDYEQDEEVRDSALVEQL